MKKILQKLTQKITDTLFPQYCLNCHREGSIVCADCFGLIEINPWQFCPYCVTPQRVIKSDVCPKHHHRPLNGLFSAVAYNQAIIKKIIHAYKYPPYLKILSTVLSQIIIAHFQTLENQTIFHKSNDVLIVPIPLTPKKIKQRGYNQSLLVAKVLCNFFALPLADELLIKVKETAPQAQLTKIERQRNIQGAFMINPNNHQCLKSKTIYLIDDVYTTGSTMNECARVLKKSGARRIYGIVIAREALN